ncbi:MULTISPECIES: DUF1289 domain-containing protein [Chitinibacter]|uniref:DUF1289 domain-containing protein n=1 Tax=Chitinibacter TaxID=230666 RepID=UPI0003FB2DCC|nr:MULTISPECIES: DUF1289 domain-containing protein [Chitinibacter]
MSTPSPCINICQLDASGAYCVGCLRTLEELRQWGKASEEEKQAILARIEDLQAASFD